MHRIAYETIIENDRKNWNEPLEFTINAINDRQYIDLYNSYITFDFNIHTDFLNNFLDENPEVFINNTAPGLIEQANISNIIYFKGDTIENATFNSIRQAPDYRTLIRSLFSNKEQEQHEEADSNLPILTNFEYSRVCQVYEHLFKFKKESDYIFSTRIKIPLRLLFEIANEENFINYKEITFKILFKNPTKYLFKNEKLNYQYYFTINKGTHEEEIVLLEDTLIPINYTYDNVQLMYHYYQDLNLTEQPAIRNTPLQAFQFPSKIIDSKNIIQKSLLMNDVYRYLMIFVTPGIESTAVMEKTLVSKITLGCQGKSFWTMNPTTDQLYDYLSYCVNRDTDRLSRITRSNYPSMIPISLFPIDEIIDYEAPGFLDVNLELTEPYNEGTIVHLVFFGK